jgi:hypothetical protein
VFMSSNVTRINLPVTIAIYLSSGAATPAACARNSSQIKSLWDATGVVGRSHPRQRPTYLTE